MLGVALMFVWKESRSAEEVDLKTSVMGMSYSRAVIMSSSCVKYIPVLLFLIPSALVPWVTNKNHAIGFIVKHNLCSRRAPFKQRCKAISSV